MNARFCLLSGLVLLLPVEARVPDSGRRLGEPGGDDSSAYLMFDLLGGRGSYSLVPRDCSGRAVGPPSAIPLEEIAGQVELGEEHLSVGVRGGFVQAIGDRPFSRRPSFHESYVREVWYWNPYVGVDWKYVGIGAGPFYATDDLPELSLEGWRAWSGHLRIGPPAAHFKFSVLEGQPLVIGGGYVQVGVGFAPEPRHSFFVGLSAAPYDGAGLAGSMELGINERMALLARGRAGTTEGQFEGGLALGLRLRAF